MHYKQFIERLKQDEYEAIKMFYSKYNERYMYYALRIVKDPHIAEDIVKPCLRQFLKALKSGKVDPTDEKHLRNMLYMVTKKRCIGYLMRRKQRRLHEVEFLSIIAADNLDAESDWDQAYEHVLAEIKSEIENLPAKTKAVFKLYYFEEKSRDEIARELGISPNTVRNQVHEGIKALREKFKDHNLMVLLILLSVQESLN
jgi:RNA polymerase sigma factor (sigma-70 family)